MTYRESHLEKSGAAYDAAIGSDGVDGYMTAREDALVRRIVKQVPKGAGRCLDFACGSGRILRAVAPEFREVVAVDVSEKMVEEARRKTPTAAFHIADITRQELALGEFDLITAFRFFGNAEDPLRREVLRKLRELSAEGGCLLINNHRNPASFLTRLSGHVAGMDLTYPKLEGLLAESGFRIASVWPIGAWMLRHRWTERRVWDSAIGRLADGLASPAWLAPYAPDMIVLARAA